MRMTMMNIRKSGYGSNYEILDNDDDDDDDGHGDCYIFIEY